MSVLKITLVQTSLHWEDRDANLAHMNTLMQQVTEATDVIVLPEMFSTGFSMNTSLAEDMQGKVMNWMLKVAAEKKAAVCGSLMMRENGVFFNRFVWVEADGKLVTYDKRHLFSMGDEHLHYEAGTEEKIISYKGFHIRPAVCYDLRFPVWLRRTSLYDYDLLLFVANWPEKRVHHWKQLLQARAIENQSYVIGVNRIGEDGNGVAHSGDSCMVSPKGDVVFLDTGKPVIKTFTLDKQEVDTYRESFPAMNDADDFHIIV